MFFRSFLPDDEFYSRNALLLCRSFLSVTFASLTEILYWLKLFAGPFAVQMELMAQTHDSCTFSITTPTDGDLPKYKIAFSQNDGSYSAFESLVTSKEFSSLTASNDYKFSAKFQYNPAEGDSVESEAADFFCITGYKFFLFSAQNVSNKNMRHETLWANLYLRTRGLLQLREKFPAPNFKCSFEKKLSKRCILHEKGTGASNKTKQNIFRKIMKS